MNDIATPIPATLDRLEISRFPIGTTSRAYVHLVDDGVGRPVRLPLLVARGRRPGPVFGVSAAVHGNELNGIQVIHRLFEWLAPSTLRGTVVAMVAVNIQGVIRHQREYMEGSDLNRLMPGRPDGNEAEVFAHRFVHRVLGSLEYLVDLHTASFGRVNSLYVRADMRNPQTSRMALLTRPQIIVHNEPADGTVRGAADDLNIPAITVEIRDPQRFQKESIRRSLAGLRAVMSALGMTPKRTGTPTESPIVCERSFWMRTDRGGLLEVFPELLDWVEEGEIVGRISSLFGDVEAEYRAPTRGIVVAKSSNPVAATGARILHLGVEAGDTFELPTDLQLPARPVET